MRYLMVLAVLACVPGPRAWAQGDAAVQLDAAQQLLNAGDLRGAIATLDAAAAASPDSVSVRLALGRALDLDGRHDAARVHLEEAVRLAPEDERTVSLAALGISYAFESRPDDSARYYQRAFDMQMQAGERAAAAALANALARIYLESGNLALAEQWYTTGYETAREIRGQTPAQIALWEMRRHHALGRIAARRGDRDAAMAHASAVKERLDRGGNDGQQPQYPYLLGYIAFYTSDFREALRQLMQGDLQDPFVLGLIAQAHERAGDRAAAAEYYRKVMASTAHSINAAFARPRARQSLIANP